METESLKKIGLSDNEIKAYVILIQLGISKTEIISHKLQFPRTTVYGLLNSLIRKGLASYSIKSGVKHYEATDPQRLLLMETEKLKELRKIVTKLEAMKETMGDKPVIENYEGKEGLKTIYEDMLKSKKTIYGYGNTKYLFEFLPYYIPNYIKKRIDSKIKFKIVTEMSNTSKKMRTKDTQESRETRFLQSMRDMTTITYIYGNKTAVIGLIKEQPFGTITTNNETSQSNLVVFNILWKNAH